MLQFFLNRNDGDFVGLLQREQYILKRLPPRMYIGSTYVKKLPAEWPKMAILPRHGLLSGRNCAYAVVSTDKNGLTPGSCTMRRWITFMIGMILGATLLYGLQRYHLIRARDGLHLIPKVESSLAATYVDIRDFTVSDWARHSEVALALVQADQSKLMEDAAADTIRQSIDRLLDPYTNAPGS
jgi:hypothetical protein